LGIKIALGTGLVLIPAWFVRPLDTPTVSTNHVFKPAYDDIVFKTDTNYITDEIYNDLAGKIRNYVEKPRTKRTLAWGISYPYANKIVIYYNITNSKSPAVQRYVDYSNSQIRLTKRHELEHARKSAFVHGVENNLPFIRGKIAMMNEVMAPAGEIIEALDHHAETGEVYPNAPNQIKSADAAIMRILGQDKLTGPVDFNNQQIADIVMEHALAKFLFHYNHGIYHWTISNAKKTFKFKSPPKNSEYMKYSGYSFFPLFNDWQALWVFETKRGMADLWKNASDEQKKRLIATTDSIVKLTR
jgi:hypothetical protein